MIRRRLVFLLASVLCLAHPECWGSERRACVVSLFKNPAEETAFRLAVEAEIPADLRDQAEWKAGIDGFQTCLGPDNEYHRVFLIAHGGVDSKEGRGVLTFPMAGATLVFPDLAFQNFARSRIEVLQIASCYSHAMQLSYMRLRDPRVQWVPASTPEGALYLDLLVQELRIFLTR